MALLQGVQPVQEAGGDPVAERLDGLQHEGAAAGAEELPGQGLHQGGGQAGERGAQHHPPVGGGR